jgi:integrase
MGFITQKNITDWEVAMERGTDWTGIPKTNETIKNYLGAARRMQRFLDAHQEEYDSVAEAIVGFMLEWRTAAVCGYRPGFVALQGFLRFIGQPEIADMLPRPYPRQEGPVHVPPDESVRALLTYPYKYPKWKLAIRLMALGGMRSGEVARARWDCVDDENGFLLIHKGKWGSRRRIPIDSDTLKLLQKIKLSFVQMKSDSPWVFPARGNHDEHITPGAIQNIVPRCCEAIGLEKFGSHGLRRWFATKAQHSMPLTYVQAFLGHSDLAHTQRYLAKVGDTQLQEAHRAMDFGI